MRAVTSSSNIGRRALCPGSHNAEAQATEEPGDNKAADEGTLLHPFACNPALKRDHLTEQQRGLLTKADRGTRGLIDRAAATFQANPLEEPPRWSEERADLYGPDGEFLFAGQSDLVFHFPEARGVAVQDFKMGFVEVAPAAENYQIASYAVIWTDALAGERAVVAINQPRAKEPLTTAHYDRRGLDNARRSLAAIYHAAEDRNAPRIPGEAQCHFCRAQLFCDEYIARFRALDERPGVQTIATMDSDTLSRFGIACKTAASIQGRVFDEITKRIEAGEMDGWELHENGETRHLTDVVGAYRELSSYFERIGGFTGQRFTECTTIAWSRLTDLVRELTGFPEHRAKALISELLNPFITRRPKAPTPKPK